MVFRDETIQEIFTPYIFQYLKSLLEDGRTSRIRNDIFSFYSDCQYIVFTFKETFKAEYVIIYMGNQLSDKCFSK